MKKTVFIDGQHGTTGLKIHERLKDRADISLLEIPAAQRKDASVKRQFLNEADIVFLCLPDDAAREAVAMIENPSVRVIDPSTAHRTSAGWVYGVPELDKSQRGKIAASTRLANPGCYATGFVCALHPLVAAGIVPASYPVTSYAITGYSGGGRQMIEAYEADSVDRQEICTRPKNLNMIHKHLAEMKMYGLLDAEPLFSPIVGDFYNGMIVFIPLHVALLEKRATAESIRDHLASWYSGERFVRVVDKNETDAIGDGFVAPTLCNGTNNLDLFVFGRKTNDLVMLAARLDNLGKGASGAAIQNMNIMLGFDESTGL